MAEKSEKETKSRGSSRREFIAATGAAIAGIAVGAAIGSQAFPKTVELPAVTRTETRTATTTVTAPAVTTTATTTAPVTVAAPKLAIVWDESKCTGCETCVYACSTYFEGAGSLSLARITLHRHIPNITYDVETCRQCVAPSCLTACLVPGAIYIDAKTGARCIDQKKCTGCGLCAKACPFNAEGAIIKYNAEKKTYVKCDLCTGRPEGPACVQVCVWGACTAKAL